MNSPRSKVTALPLVQKLPKRVNPISLIKEGERKKRTRSLSFTHGSYRSRGRSLTQLGAQKVFSKYKNRNLEAKNFSLLSNEILGLENNNNDYQPQRTNFGDENVRRRLELQRKKDPISRMEFSNSQVQKSPKVMSNEIRMLKQRLNDKSKQYNDLCTRNEKMNEKYSKVLKAYKKLKERLRTKSGDVITDILKNNPKTEPKLEPSNVKKEKGEPSVVQTTEETLNDNVKMKKRMKIAERKVKKYKRELTKMNEQSKRKMELFDKKMREYATIKTDDEEKIIGLTADVEEWKGVSEKYKKKLTYIKNKFGKTIEKDGFKIFE